MSTAWNALASRLAKVERRVQTEAAEAVGLPDGIVGVMLWGIAVQLGGFPMQIDPLRPYGGDDVFLAVERALGYPDWAERRGTGEVVRDADWLQRFATAAGQLSLAIGLGTDSPKVGEETTLIAFVQMLADLDARSVEWGSSPAWPRRHPWPTASEDMNRWIGWAGLSPEVVRAKARAASISDPTPEL